MGLIDHVRAFMSGEPPLASAMLRAAPTVADAKGNLAAEQRWSQAFGSWRMAKRGDVELLKSYGENPHLFGPVSLVAEGVAKAFQPQLFQTKGNARARDVVAYQRAGGALETLMQDGQLVELADHDALRLLRRPMPGVPAMDFYELAATFFLLLGETFMTKEGRPAPGQGQPVSLNIFSPTQLQRRASADSPSFEVRVRAGVDTVGVLDTIWTRRINPSDIFTGVGIGAGRALKDEIAMDEAMSATARARYKNHLFVDLLLGLLGSPTMGIPPPGPQGVVDFAKNFEDKHRGEENAGRAHFFGGDFKAQQLGHSLVESQYIEGRQNNAVTVRRTLRVPPEKTGDLDNANRSTIDAAETMYQTGCVVPVVDRLVAAFQEQLIPDFGTDLILGCRNPVPADKDFKKAVMVAVPSCFRRNDFRKLAGEKPLSKEEGGEDFVSTDLKGDPITNANVPVPDKPKKAPATNGAPQ